MSYEATVKSWETPEAVDWNVVRDTLGANLREIIATFCRQNPEAAVYGIVIVHGQNWELSTFLNTEEGFATMPARFRTQCVNWPVKTDAELLEALGRWYFDAWKFDYYEFKCSPEVDEVNKIHYELFERWSDDVRVATGRIDFGGYFLRSCAEALAVLERSHELKALPKTKDFEIRFFDANCYKWDTAALMEAARRQIDKLEEQALRSTTEA